jgi:hypothetical protein
MDMNINMNTDTDRDKDMDRATNMDIIITLLSHRLKLASDYLGLYAVQPKIRKVAHFVIVSPSNTLAYGLRLSTAGVLYGAALYMVQRL